MQSKRQGYRKNTSTRSISPRATNQPSGGYLKSTGNLNNKEQTKHMEDYESEIYEFNFRVLAREPNLRNIEKILFSIDFAQLAKFQISGSYWNYLKVKGPLFVIMDKHSQIKIVVLNQFSKDNFIIHVQEGMLFQLQTLQNDDGFMLNYLMEDSITGKTVYGIWTANSEMTKIYSYLKSWQREVLKNQKQLESEEKKESGN